MRPIRRSRQYLVPTNGNISKGGRVLFPLDQYLKDALIVGVETFDDQQLTFGDNGAAICPTAEFIKASVTLVKDSKEIYKGVPLVLWNPVSMFGIFKELHPTRITLEQCYVQANDSIASAAPFSFGFVFHYIDPADLRGE